MYVIEGRNVNDNYPALMKLIRAEGEEGPSRAGGVKALPSPVMLVTHRPMERVLFDEKREANPFFHLFEALFLLAGRDDYTFLDRFVHNFSSRFAETGGRGHGSYGIRWRSHFGFDQLDTIVEKLRADPYDRRVVLSMWDASRHTTPYPDDPEGADDLRVSAQDVPCNTHIYPRVVGGRLDLTVCCRSNDAIWGATGANVVQFSMLQEYLAGRVGVGVGRLYQLANNMHAYTDRLDRYGVPETDRWGENIYDRFDVLPTPIGENWASWDLDLRMFMDWTENPDRAMWPENTWFATVAAQMWAVHKLYSDGHKEDALNHCQSITADDWRIACQAWIRRRMK